MNYAKSAITFSKGIPAAKQEALKQLTGISKIGGFGRYPGLPEKIGRKRKDAFEFIKQRIKNKTDSWYNRFLSQAGKEVLIKSVLTALPTYAMSCFMLTKGILKDISSTIRRFWWSSCKQTQKISWISWKKSQALNKEGWDLEIWNTSALLCWLNKDGES